MANYKIQEADLQKILTNLLEKNIVEGIMVQKKGDHGIFPALITDPDLLDGIVPSAPLFSFNRASTLQNNGCKKIAVVVNPCEARAINFEQEDEIIEAEVGSIIVATGYDSFDPSVIPQYGYGRYDNVFTALQFERMCNASGPTDGEIKLKDGQIKKHNLALKKDKRTNRFYFDGGI